jgi:EmrB/QacA subfamily drug resistance transporter
MRSGLPPRPDRHLVRHRHPLDPFLRQFPLLIPNGSREARNLLCCVRPTCFCTSANGTHTVSTTAPPQIDDVTHRRRWIALAVISMASLMVVLDASVVNIALPPAQEDLNLTTANRHWVITAYTLTFGGLLLLGGRVADFVGHKRVFLVALIGFTFASALGGLAATDLMLFAARALQGLFAAALAPAALSLIATTFTNPRELAKAFGVYGAIQGAGGAIGLILGGLLTEYLGWRWCLFINIPIAVITLIAAIPTLRESRATGTHTYDIPGAVLVTLGAGALVLGFTSAAEGQEWTAPQTLIPIALALALFAAFVVVERQVTAPLLPLRLLLDRDRGGAFALSSLVGAGMFGLLLFLAYYLQTTLGMTPLQAGLAFLPFSAGIIISAMVSSTLLPHVGAKPLLVGGAIIATIGTILLTLINEESTWLIGVLPGEIVTGLGLGLVFVPLNAVALNRVHSDDVGITSAIVNTTQQLGGALGTALLSTVFAMTIATVTTSTEVFSGYRAVFTGAAILFGSGALIAALLMRNTPKAGKTTSTSTTSHT